MQRTLFSSALVLLLLPAATLFAQPDFSEDVYHTSTVTLEVGTSVGAMNCLTDLGGTKGGGKKFIGDINFKNSELCASIYFATFYKNAIGLRFETTWGVIKASDNVSASLKGNTFGRYERNLSFRSTLFEMMLAAEIHPLYLMQRYSPTAKVHRFSPYITGGLGFFVFDPLTKYKGEWIALQPLHTEGQGFAEYPERKPYKLKQFNFPAGGGLQFRVIPNVNLRAECVYRFLTTDYLDDVSTRYIERKLFRKYLEPGLVENAEKLFDRQREIDPNHATNVGDIRGNPEKKDAYFSFNFKIGILF